MKTRQLEYNMEIKKLLYLIHPQKAHYLKQFYEKSKLLYKAIKIHPKIGMLPKCSNYLIPFFCAVR